MPNHVFQKATLTIEDPNIRATVIALAEKGESILKHFLPTAKEGTDQWHTAAIEMWGSKWGDYETALEDVQGFDVDISFASAWNCAAEGFKRLSALLDGRIILRWREEQPSDIGAAVFAGKSGVLWAKSFYNQDLDDALARLGKTPYPENADDLALDPESGLSVLDTYYQNMSDAESALEDELDTMIRDAIGILPVIS